MHQLTVPDDVDEVWLERKMRKPDVSVGGEIKVKIIFDRPSKKVMEVQALDAVQAAKDYISKSEENDLFKENVALHVLLPWTVADSAASGVPYNEELRIAVIEEYVPLFRQYILKFGCRYKLHVAREKGVQYISNSNTWKASVDTSTQRRVKAAEAAFLLLDQKLTYCMGKKI